MDEFTKKFLDLVWPSQTILDLGAGIGTYSEMFADRDALVTAVDKHIPNQIGDNITCVRMTAEKFITQDEHIYDGAFFRNIMQFFDKTWTFEHLFPWLGNHLKPGGVIAIETFYQEPNPPFDHPLASLYTMQELQQYFGSWQEIYARHYEHKGSDMSGRNRQFYISDLIIRRNNDH